MPTSFLSKAFDDLTLSYFLNFNIWYFLLDFFVSAVELPVVSDKNILLPYASQLRSY